MAIYKLLLYLILPFVFIRLWWRGRRNPAYRLRWRERLGRSHHVVTGVIWIHAVSVGEAEAAAPLVKALNDRYPDIPLLITTTTPTGSERVRARYPAAMHVYLPLDLPFAVRHFLSAWQPCIGIVMETEIWPNLVLECQKLSIPMVIANARLSEKSFSSYNRFRRILAPVLGWLHIAARSEQDQLYFSRLGAGKVDVMGNIKLDIQTDTEVVAAARQIQDRLVKPVWVAASTHKGEDEIILAAHKQLLQARPDYMLVLVPRHPERFDDVVKLVQKQGMDCQRFSQPADQYDGEVLVGDTMGDLLKFYALADIAFIGGSLVNTGGHNPYEALLYNAAVLSGPYYFNFEEAYRNMEASNAVVFVTADNLASRLASLIGSPEQVQRLQEQGRTVLQQGQGATARLMQIIQNEIDEKSRT